MAASSASSSGAPTVIVTGGCGFLGSHITSVLLSATNYKIAVWSRHPTPTDSSPRISYHAVDLSSQDSIHALLSDLRPRAIVNTVSAGPYASLTQSIAVNIDNTRTLLTEAEAADVEAFVCTGTLGAVLRSSSQVSEETAVLRDLEGPGGTPYERTKGAMERLVLSWNKRHGSSMKTVVLRVAGLYGERDKYTVNTILATLQRNPSAPFWQVGRDESLFSFVYAENAARAHMLALRNLLKDHESAPIDLAKRSKVEGEAFFIADGDIMTLWEFTRLIWAAAGAKMPLSQREIRVVPLWLMLTIGSIIEWLWWVITLGRGANPPLTRAMFEYMCGSQILDISKARERLGYRPVCGTEEGVDRTVKWFMEHKEWIK